MTGMVCVTPASTVEVVVNGGSVEVMVSLNNTEDVCVGRLKLLGVLLVLVLKLHGGHGSSYSQHNDCLHQFYSVSCVRTFTQPIVTTSVPVATSSIFVTNTVSTFTIVTPPRVLLSETVTITVPTTVATLSPSATISVTSTSTVFSTPPIVGAVITITTTAIERPTNTVTFTLSSTSTILNTFTVTSQVPCQKHSIEARLVSPSVMSNSISNRANNQTFSHKIITSSPAYDVCILDRLDGATGFRLPATLESSLE
uniref:Uncharacterized protein n=1 Tax=Anopheles atroparvus TaxID=41427 RepID=A0A182JHN9_ANOAO